MGQTVKGGEIARPAYRKPSREEANAPLVKGVKGKDQALGNMTARAREIARLKAESRMNNKAQGLKSNAGSPASVRAQGSTKKTMVAKAEPRYKAPGTSGPSGYLKKITNDMEKR
jgi:hypothetical protein